jgi:hypothetical protein
VKKIMNDVWVPSDFSRQVCNVWVAVRNYLTNNIARCVKKYERGVGAKRLFTPGVGEKLWTRCGCQATFHARCVKKNHERGVGTKRLFTPGARKKVWTRCGCQATFYARCV